MSAVKPLLLLASLVLSSCSLFSDGEAPEVSETKPRLVGRIASIPDAGDFVLIEAYGKWSVPEGGLLSGIGSEGRTSNLVATGERLGQFSAADIRSGVAKVGDSVYYRPIREQEEGNASVDSPVPSTAEAELETKTNTGESTARP
jgi:hypothetical protein